MIPLMSVTRNFFMGREPTKGKGLLKRFDVDSANEITMEEMRKMGINLRGPDQAVGTLSGGERQTVAIARAVYFNARILIMDEPTAALGPHETQMVAELIQELKAQGLGIFLIEHDIHAVMELCDRAVVMKNGQRVGAVNVGEVTDDDILGMIIMGKKPPQAY